MTDGPREISAAWEKLAGLLLSLRKAAGLTQTDVAKRLRTSQARLSKIETCRARPTREEIGVFASSLQLDEPDRRLLDDAFERLARNDAAWAAFSRLTDDRRDAAIERASRPRSSSGGGGGEHDVLSNREAARVGNAAGRNALLATARHSPDSAERHAAADYLKQLTDPTIREDLYTMALGPAGADMGGVTDSPEFLDDTFVQLRAAQGLVRLKDARAASVLRDLIERMADEDPVKPIAATTLMTVGDPGGAYVLRHLASHPGDDREDIRIRTSAVKGLASSRSKIAQEYLLDLLDSNEPLVQLDAALELVARGHEAAHNILRQLAGDVRLPWADRDAARKHARD